MSKRYPKTVNYYNIREKLQTGDLLVFGGFFLGSKIIKWCTRSKVSHVAIILRNPNDNRLSLFEVGTPKKVPEHGGVNIHKVSDYLPFYHGNVWVLKLNEEKRSKFKDHYLRSFVESTLGENYDYVGAGLAGWDLFDNIRGAAQPRSNSYFCSELVAEAYIHSHVFPPNIDPEEITPKEITQLNIFEEQYYHIRKSKSKTVAIKRNITTIDALPTITHTQNNLPSKSNSTLKSQFIHNIKTLANHKWVNKIR